MVKTICSDARGAGQRSVVRPTSFVRNSRSAKTRPFSSYLAIYGLSIIGEIVSFSATQLTWILGTLKAARIIHELLVTSIVTSTLGFLDRTPVGRITQRFTQDIGEVDTGLSREAYTTFEVTLKVLVRLLIVVYYAPIFVVPSLLMMLAGLVLAQLYVQAQRSVKRFVDAPCIAHRENTNLCLTDSDRETSNARAPVYSIVGATIEGLATIRAYRAEDRFRNGERFLCFCFTESISYGSTTQDSMTKIDKYCRAKRPYTSLNR